MTSPIRRMKLAHLAVVLCLMLAHQGKAGPHYVVADFTNAVSPYTSWETAASNIQQALGAAGANDTVLVSNGVYNSNNGGALVEPSTNRIYINQSGLRLQAVSTNPADTIIAGAPDPVSGQCGDAAIRCIFVYNNNVTVSGFTLSNGYTKADRSGGGLISRTYYGTVISNCVIRNCGAGVSGGGVYSDKASNPTNCLLINSVVRDNSAASSGGGVYQGYLTNCQVTGNSSTGSYGGGTAFCNINRSTISGNSAFGGGGGTYYGNLNGCTVVSNIATHPGGGGLLGPGESATNCTFAFNILTAGYGGGMGIYDNTRVINCLIYSNFSLRASGINTMASGYTNNIVVPLYDCEQR